LGSAALETNENGQVISYEEYHPFGTSAYRVARSGTDLSLKRYRFTNKERDDETGLYYFGVRYYAAWLGRWTSSDPGDFVDGLNLYQYAQNNPVKLVDAEGYKAEPVEDSEGVVTDNANVSDGKSSIQLNDSPHPDPWKNFLIWSHLDDPKLNFLHSDNVINMSNANSIQSWNSLGAPRSSGYFWKEYQNTPLGKQALSKDNLTRIANNRVPEVDAKWNSAMKTFGVDGVDGEQIQHHHMGKQSASVPMPASKHGKFSKYFHDLNHRKGPVNQTKNNVKNRTGRYDPNKGSALKKLNNVSRNLSKGFVIIDLVHIFGDSPKSSLYMFHSPGSGDENRAYPTNLWGADDPMYYEWHLRDDGTRIIEYFNDYKKVDGQWRGVDPTGGADGYDKKGNRVLNYRPGAEGIRGGA
jgi:RHS repeat-associated protein